MEHALAEAFVAEGPRPELAERLSLFAPLIGSWDLIVYEGEQRTTAEWHFGWALDGRAVADVWISPRREEGVKHEGEWGLSLRFYDPAIGAWRSTWHGPKRGWVIPFRAGPSAEGIELGGERDGIELRWIFSELAPDSFRWRAEENGVVRQRFEAVRRV